MQEPIYHGKAFLKSKYNSDPKSGGRVRKLDSKELIIHIGLQKAGSTFLQHSLWPELFPKFSYSIGGVRKVRIGSRQAMKFLQSDSLSTNVRSNFISCEKLSGKLRPSSPGESWAVFEEFYEAALKVSRRIDVKIIVFLRPQSEWVKSAYLYTKKEGSSDSFEMYLNRFNGDDLSWEKRIKKLQSFNLLAIVWDDFINSPEMILEKICEFTNKSIGKDEAKKALGRGVKKNISPKTKSAVRYSCFEARLRSRLNKLPGVSISQSYQEKGIDFLNKRGKTLSLEVPREWSRYFNQDWEKVLQLIQ
ncbi:MAG: hypothetical protein ACQEUG_17815 [Pseudomonadota bacterium]